MMSAWKPTIDPHVRANQVRNCLKVVLTSDEFGGSRRLQEFLTYVVEEKLAGREDRIKGKTIAEDVYGRKISGRSQDVSVVRVDGSRLRQRLGQYNSGPGRQDALRIEIPTGTYVPEFVDQENTIERATGTAWLNRNSVYVAALTLITLLGVGSVIWSQIRHVGVEVPAPPLADLASAIARGDRNEMKRRAMFDKSPASLQAYDIAQQARDLIWPPLDPARRQTALELFERAIDIDSSHYGGYAGAAQVLAFRAFVPGPGDRQELIAKARAMGERAQELNATSAWVQSALAWLSFVSGDIDRAVELSDRAVSLDPSDGYVLDFHGAILVLNGDFERVVQDLGPHLSPTEKSLRFVHRNIYAMANFHLGNHQKAIDLLNEITDLGGAISPLTTAYLAASHQALGNRQDARKLASDLTTSWPDFRIDHLLRTVFRHPKHPEEVLSQLRATGWKSAEHPVIPSQ
jgi:tetratricopeptide (TPR) repeat protein